MKLKKLGAFAATGAMALALALTGCGSSNATSGSDAGSSSSDDAKVEKVDGSKEYALVKDGTLTVGTSAEYAPFEYKDDNGDYQGFDLELIKAIGDKLGLDVEYVNNDFDTLVPGVAFTVAIRDAADGDYISGTVRMIDALLVFICIAIGVGMGIAVLKLLTGGADL